MEDLRRGLTTTGYHCDNAVATGQLILSLAASSAEVSWPRGSLP
jgi:hypothetical protein